MLACADPTSPSGPGLVSGVTYPAWSADGREILFTSLEPGAGAWVAALKAVNVTSRAVRTIATTATGTSTGGELIRVPPTGGFVFFAIAAWRGPSYVILRVRDAGGQVDTIATDAKWPWFQVSDDGRLVAYHGGANALNTGGVDSLKVVDGTRAFGAVVRASPASSGPLAMWSFSPDGSSLVYWDRRVMQLDVPSGIATVLYVPPAASVEGTFQSVAGSVWWQGGHPHLLVDTWVDKRQPTSIYDLDGTTGARTLLGTLLDSEHAPWNMAWSPDGSHAAIWTSSKSFNCSVEGCSYDARLYLIARGIIGAGVLYDSRGAAASPTWTVFSPDGQSVGAVNWGGLFVFSF